MGTNRCLWTFQALFVKVVPYQCLGCMWSQRDKKENMSPTIRATIAQFNTITNWVIGSLLCPPCTSSRVPPTSAAQRACIIEKWIKVAQVGFRDQVTEWWLYFQKICLTQLPKLRKKCLLSLRIWQIHEMQVVYFAGMPSLEELLFSEGHPVCPSFKRNLQAEEDLGCCVQVGPFLFQRPRAFVCLYARNRYELSVL